jgi:hypothetical protein
LITFSFSFGFTAWLDDNIDVIIRQDDDNIDVVIWLEDNN